MITFGMALCRIAMALGVASGAGFLFLTTYAGYLLLVDRAAFYAPTIPRWAEVVLSLSWLSVCVAGALLAVSAVLYFATREKAPR